MPIIQQSRKPSLQINIPSILFHSDSINGETDNRRQRVISVLSGEHIKIPEPRRIKKNDVVSRVSGMQLYEHDEWHSCNSQWFQNRMRCYLYMLTE